MYEIERTKAFKYGLKYMIPQGILPNIIPLQEFTAHPVLRQGQPSAKATESQKTDGRQSRNLQFNF